MIIQYISSYPPSWRPFLHPQPENAPCRGGRDPLRWEDNIKMDLQKIGCVDMEWIELAQDRDRWRALVNVVTNLRVP